MKFLNTKGNLNIIERDDYEERNIVLDESLFDLRMSELNSHLVNKFMRYVKNSNERPILFVITAPGTEEDIEDMFEMYVIGLLQAIVNNQKPKKERR